jgi:hypothetical protein
MSAVVTLKILSAQMRPSLSIVLCCTSPAKEEEAVMEAVTTARYETFPDPFDNWIVWDCERDDVATLGSEYLLSLTEADASAACNLMNGLMPRRAA